MLGLFACTAQTESQSASHVPLPSLIRMQAGESWLCGMQQVRLSGDGLRIALMNYGPDQDRLPQMMRAGHLVILSPGPQGSGETIVDSLAPAQFREVAPLEEGAFLVVDHPNWIFTLTPRRAPEGMDIQRLLPLGWLRDGRRPVRLSLPPHAVARDALRRVTEGGPGTGPAPREPTFPGMGGWTRTAWAIWAVTLQPDATPLILGGDLGRRVLVDVGVARPLPPEINHLSVPDATATRGPSGQLVITGQGAFATEVGGRMVLREDVPLYVQPVAEAAATRVHMVHGTASVVALSNDRQALAANITKSLEGAFSAGWHLRSLAVHPELGVWAALLRAGAGPTDSDDREALLVVADSRRGEAQVHACGNAGYQTRTSIQRWSGSGRMSVNVPAPRAPRWLTTLESDDYRMGVWDDRREDARGTVVFFRGGPDISVIPFQADPLLDAYAALGYRILQVEYAGASSTDARLSFWNARDRARAQEIEADLLAEHLAEMPRPLKLVGNSWGGAWLPGLATRIPEVSGILLTSPFSRLRHTADDELRETIFRLMNAEWFAYRERTSYGSPADDTGLTLKDWADSTRRRMCGSPDLRIDVFFGDLDQKAEPARWAKACPNARVTVIPGAGHSIHQHAELLSFVREATGAMGQAPVKKAEAR